MQLLLTRVHLQVRMINVLIKRYIKTSVVVGSVTEALQLLTNNQFQFVFLDHNLPDGSGADVLPFIKKMQPQAKCISISNDVDIKDFHQQLGYDEIFCHPFNKSVERIFR